MPRAPALFSLADRVAVVTGGSRGLGLEIARGLGEAGARVVIAARRAEWLDQASAELAAEGIEARAQVCDLSDEAQVGRLIEAAVSAFGRLDVLVNNAGVSWGAPIEEMPLDRWRQVIDTNIGGTFLATRAALPLMKARGYGKIITVASVAGVVGFPAEILDAAAYTASKGALIALTRDLAVKCAPFGIRVNAIAPGFFRTRMTERVLVRAEGALVKATPLGRVGEPEDLKGVAVFLAAPASDYITGQVLGVDGGYTAA